MPQKRFCLLTTGRTGSTSLINALAEGDDVLVPNKLFDCPDNELVHPDKVRDYIEVFAKLSGKGVGCSEELIEGFFEWDSRAAYVGFKSMPTRHRNYADFIRRPDIKFILLTRADLPATVASFMTAMRTGSWRRYGGGQTSVWTFRQEDRKLALGNLGYIQACQRMLSAVPGAIRLSYEQLCDPAFSCAELDEFFARPVRIRNPMPPTDAAEYVTNWPEFSEFIHTALAGMGP
jgi:LPS sulfotransferase NodH